MISCAGCNREIEVGDRYILDTPAGFMKKEPDPMVDGIIAELFGATDGKVRFCEDCTEPGGNYHFETYYGDEE